MILEADKFYLINKKDTHIDMIFDFHKDEDIIVVSTEDGTIVGATKEPEISRIALVIKEYEAENSVKITKSVHRKYSGHVMIEAEFLDSDGEVNTRCYTLTQVTLY